MSMDYQATDAVYKARAAVAESRDVWLDPLCSSLPTGRKGPFLVRADGSLLTVDRIGLLSSRDDGATWGEPIPAALGQNPQEPASCAVVEPIPGTLVMVYLDMRTRRFAWNAAVGEPGDEARLEMHAARSVDGGRTWGDARRLLSGYNGNFFGFIQTRSGRLVVAAEHLVGDPGRWVVCSFTSDDDGRTWFRGNFIDLGGHGHHDGAIEPTVAERGDGRLLMLIRTNLGQFWQAFSDDGRFWRRIEPSPVSASSSPGQLLRLRSGRLLLVYNPRDPESGSWPLTKNDEQHSELPTSWHREELAAVVSSDDGETWSRPLVLARLQGGQISYPHVIERRAGEIWITAGFASRAWFNDDPVPVGVSIREAELVNA